MAREAGHRVGGRGQDVGFVLPLFLRLRREIGRRVQEDVEPRRDVQVGALQGSRQREDERDVVVALRTGGAGDGGQRVRRDAAGQGGVVMDVEFEEVEEWVGDGGDGAVDVLGRF